MRTIEKNIVGALIFSNDGKILQGLKDPKSPYNIWPECWHIPGGALEEGEGWEEALVREVREEVGLDIAGMPLELIDSSKFSGEKTLRTGERVFQNMSGRVYKVLLDKPAEDIIVALDDEEFVEFAWHTPAEIKNIKVTPPSVELFTKLGYL